MTQLNDIDLNEIFNISHPEVLVESLLESQKKGKPEPRYEIYEILQKITFSNIVFQNVTSGWFVYSNPDLHCGYLFR